MGKVVKKTNGSEVKEKALNVDVQLNCQEATLVVSRTVLKQPQPDKIEKIKIKPFITQTARVGMSASRTIGLKNYGSIKIGVWMEAPCYIEEYKEVTDQIKEIVEERLLAEIEETEEAMGDEIA